MMQKQCVWNVEEHLQVFISANNTFSFETVEDLWPRRDLSSFHPPLL